MAFSTEIEKQNNSVVTLARIRPRKQILDWVESLDYPGTWYTTLAVTNLINVYNNTADEGATEVSQLSDLASGEDKFFYDGETIYYRPYTGEDPNLEVVIVEWELYLSTTDLPFYKIPTDATSEEIMWEGRITVPPALTQGNTDLVFGVLPVQISAIAFAMPDDFLVSELDEMTLYNCQIKVWEIIGDRVVSNCSEVFIGACGNFSFRDGTLTVQITDPLRILESSPQLGTYSLGDYPGIDPDKIGAFKRKILGSVPYLIPVNLDYDATPGTSVNRIWSVSEYDSGGVPDLESLVDTGYSNTATTTKVADASGFVGGGLFQFSDAVIIKDGGVDKYAWLTNVDLNTNILTHTSIGARAPVGTDSVRRSGIGSIVIQSGAALYRLAYGRDFIEYNTAGMDRGFILTNNFEANHGGLGTFDPANMILTCRVYSGATLPKKYDDTTDMGSLSEYGGNISNPALLIWKMIREEIPGADALLKMDETTFSAMIQEFDRPISLMVPPSYFQEPQTYRTIFTALLQTELMKLHFKIANSEAVLAITQEAPFGASYGELNALEVDGPEYQYNFDDIYSRVKVFYTDIDAGWAEGFEYVVGLSGPAQYLHRIQKTLEFDSLFADTSYINILTTRLLILVSSRKGTISGTVPNRFKEKTIGEVIDFTSKNLPGGTYGEDTTRQYKIVRHTKGRHSTVIELDDQKGIQDGEGSW